jgi:hypothetical protein
MAIGANRPVPRRLQATAAAGQGETRAWEPPLGVGPRA